MNSNASGISRNFRRPKRCSQAVERVAHLEFDEVPTVPRAQCGDRDACNLPGANAAAPGDGNLDGVVDAEVIVGIFNWWRSPLMDDFNNDGRTDGDGLGEVLNGWTGRP
ncbi:MAG: hypothetical protein LW636_01190 [Planctomycetaceae bacterium]|nr:hypothetical protein [Planctomycetaceae bacterium]